MALKKVEDVAPVVEPVVLTNEKPVQGIMIEGQEETTVENNAEHKLENGLIPMNETVATTTVTSTVKKTRAIATYDDPEDDFPMRVVGTNGVKNASARAPIVVPSWEVIRAAAKAAGYEIKTRLTSRGNLVADISISKVMGETTNVFRVKIVADGANLSRVSRFMYAVNGVPCDVSTDNKGFKTVLPIIAFPLFGITEDPTAQVNLATILADVRTALKADAAAGKFDKVITGTEVTPPAEESAPTAE